MCLSAFSKNLSICWMTRSWHSVIFIKIWLYVIHLIRDFEEINTRSFSGRRIVSKDFGRPGLLTWLHWPSALEVCWRTAQISHCWWPEMKYYQRNCCNVSCHADCNIHEPGASCRPVSPDWRGKISQNLLMCVFTNFLFVFKLLRDV
jgi:hypothetical protein